jgi:hypothetical protein
LSFSEVIVKIFSPPRGLVKNIFGNNFTVSAFIGVAFMLLDEAAVEKFASKFASKVNLFPTVTPYQS